MMTLRPRDVREVLVTGEAEAAEGEGAVAVLVGLDRSDLRNRVRDRAHWSSFLLAVVLRPWAVEPFGRSRPSARSCPTRPASVAAPRRAALRGTDRRRRPAKASCDRAWP